jgi:O-antigen ligase
LVDWYRKFCGSNKGDGAGQVFAVSAVTGHHRGQEVYTAYFCGVFADPTPVFHHTHYGFMLAVTLTFVLQRFFYEKYTPLLRFVVILFLCTATINIFITAGRTGYVLYIILLLTMFMLVFRARLVAAGSVALLVICVSLGLAYGFSDTFQKRLNQTVDSIEAMTVQGDFESSLGARAAVIGSSKDVVLDNWLFGVGTGDHLDTVRKHIDQAYPQYSHMANSFQHLHNEYFSAITQFGLLGLMAFLYLLFQLVVYPQEDQALKNAQIILAVATALFGIIDIVVLGLGALLLLVTISGLSLNHYTVSNARLPQMSRKLIAMYAVSITSFELVSWVT